tara:strand:- start:9169 stop:10221 length:1053 start_codon:yes stop_codon:yes gene_type:complete
MKLEYGYDFRDIKYRREVFLRFYEFHLKYKAHPGAVYYAFDYLFDYLKCDEEQKLWILFLNGCTQNIVTTFVLFKHFPHIHKLDVDKLDKFIKDNWKGLFWDMDRRYVKIKTAEIVTKYKALVKDSQVDYFNNIMNTDSPEENFRRIWKVVMKDFDYFGRLATFSYLEYLKIGGLNLECDSLFLDDINGSKSHRNGIAKVIGRDDLEWKKGNDVVYTPQDIEMFQEEGKKLLEESKKRITHKDLSYFTLESTLCCYKGWHRPNRRYPNVYNDMFAGRIEWSLERLQDKDVEVFWDFRKDFLPKELRIEDNPKDVGVKPIKQNHYLNTGQVIMMDIEWDCFRNEYNQFTRS